LQPAPQLAVPTLVLHGAADGVNEPQSSEGRQGYFTGRYERQLLDGVVISRRERRPTPWRPLCCASSSKLAELCAWVTESSFAAALNLRSRAVASKALSAFNDERGGRILFIPFALWCGT